MAQHNADSAKYTGTTRTCPLCFRTCQIVEGGKYPKHVPPVSIGVPSPLLDVRVELCPVSGRYVSNNGVVM